jgi:hypothetical protein
MGLGLKNFSKAGVYYEIWTARIQILNRLLRQESIDASIILREDTRLTCKATSEEVMLYLHLMLESHKTFKSSI